MSESNGGINFKSDTYKWGDDIEFKSVIKKMTENGVDFKERYKVSFKTLLEVRKARGAIMQSVLKESQLSEGFMRESVQRKLDRSEIDKLTNLTTLAVINNGMIFWCRKLNLSEPVVKMQEKVLTLMSSFTSHILNENSFSSYANPYVMSTPIEYLKRYQEEGVPKTDNLGEHFAWHSKPHIFLDKISIDDLRNKTLDQGRIVVLAAAASSGTLEAGIFAHYMNKELKIPTTVDPVFFNNHHSSSIRAGVMNSIMPRQPAIVIPLDDEILGSGYSPARTKQIAIEKYGDRSLVMSEKMKGYGSKK